MLKRITIILFGFIAGVLGNLIAAYVQQDVWSNVFTQDRLLVTTGSILLMLLLVASLETERALAWNWRWHRFWYLRELSQNPDLRHWESDFAHLEMVQGKRARISSAEVLAAGIRKDMIEVLRGLIKDREGKNARALILGEPGSGKTTGLERLTLDLARAGKRRLGIGCKMPVLVRLGNFQEGRLVDHIAQTMRHSTKHSSGKILGKGIEMLLEKGRVVLLCDALDEALGMRRDLVIAELKNLLTSQAYQNVPIIITSRTREDPGEALKGLTAFEIQDLNDEAVNAFVRAYKRPEHNEAEIMQRLESHRLLEAGGLGRNPFWLRLIVASGVFEGNKGQILNNAVDNLLAREWDEKPRVERTWQRVLPKEEQLRETKYALAWLGYRMSYANQAAPNYDQARAELERCLNSRKQVGVESLRPQDVLGLGRDAQILAYQPNPIRFRHRLLQECMTAWMLKENPGLLGQELERCDHDIQKWPTLLMLGDLVDNRESFVHQVLGDEDSFARVLLAFGILEPFTERARNEHLADKEPKELNDVLKSLLPWHECKEKWQALLLRMDSYSAIEWQVTRACISFLVAGFSGKQIHLCKKATQTFGEGIVARFATLLTVDSDAIRAKAIALLQNLESPKAAEYLVIALGDEKLCNAASQALVQVGAPAIKPLVQALRWRHSIEPIQIDANELEEHRDRVQRAKSKMAQSIELLEAFENKKNVRTARKQLQQLELREQSFVDEEKWVRKMQELQEKLPNLDQLRKQMGQSFVQAFKNAGLPEGAQLMASYVEHEEWLMSRIPEPEVVIDTLAQIGEPVVDALVELIDSKSFSDISGAQAAIEVLKRIASPKAIDALVDKLANENLMSFDTLIPGDAIKALRAIGEPAIPTLLRALNSENEMQRLRAFGILRDIGQPAVTPLLEALRDENNFSDLGIILLREIADPPKNLDTLIKALENGHSNLSFAAEMTLHEIGDAAIDKLITVIGDKESSFAIARLMANIGIPAIRSLTKGLSHQNPKIRSGAGQALAAIASRYPINDTKTIQALVQVMKDDDKEVSSQAESALAQNGAPAVENISSLLDDQDAKVRMSAVFCFFLMGIHNAVNLTKPLLKALNDPLPEIRYWAIAALGRAGDRHALIPLFNKLLVKPEGPRPARVDILKVLGRIAFRPIIDLKMAKQRRVRSRHKMLNRKAALPSSPK